MHLMHNQAFKLTTEALGLPEGIFRIIVDDSSTDTTYCVLIKQDSPQTKVLGGRPRIEDQKLKRKKRVHGSVRISVCEAVESVTQS